MAASPIQATNAASVAFLASTTLTTSAFGSSVTAGNNVLVAVSWDDSTNTIGLSSVQDSNGKAFTLVGSRFHDANDNSTQHAYGENVAGGAGYTVTATFGGSQSFRRIVAEEWSGLATSSSLDKDSGGKGQTGTALTDTSVTPAANGEAIFSHALTAGGTSSDAMTVGGSWTEPTNGTARNGATTENELAIAHAVQTSAAANATTWTRPSSGLVNMRTSTYKVPSANPILAAGAGSYVLSGTATALKVARKVVAGAGSFVITGVAATLRRVFKLPAAAGSFTLTGTAVVFHRTYILPVGAGSFVLSGTATGVYYGRKLVAGTNSFALTGTAVTLRRNLPLVAGGGSFLLTGASVALVQSTANTFIVADAGSFQLAGSNIAILHKYILGAASATYTLSGTAAFVGRQFKAQAALGNFLLSGQSATLRRTLIIVGGAAAFILDGKTVALTYSGNPAPTGANNNLLLVRRHTHKYLD